MGFVFFIVFMLGIGLVIALIAFFLLLIIGFPFFLVMGINLRKTEEKRSVRYFIAAGVDFAILAYIIISFIIAAGYIA